MKLELKGITKRFGPLTANDSIDLVIEPGQIHALLGENGAGKSTLMNVLYGLYEPDEGSIVIDGKPVRFQGPGDAVAAGIGMVHQHFMLVPVFTVAESVALGYEPTSSLGRIDFKAAEQKVTELSDRFRFNINPRAYVGDLDVGAQQRVEIIKALSRDAQVLVLDEPTAVLTPHETDELLDIMRELRESGTSIVFISHKLREVRAVADAITVIRRGAVVGEASPTSSQAELASMMVGRAVDLGVEKDPAEPGGPGFVAKGLTVLDNEGRKVVDNVDLHVERGEILCIGGVQGNGQTELAEAILGIRTPAAGTMTLDGEDLISRSIKHRLHNGLGFVPEDRQKDGMITSFSIADNMVLDLYDVPPQANGLAIRPGVVLERAAALRDEFDVRVTTVKDPISTLSGGNAQKAILARAMSRDLRLLVVSQPTRGVDVGSIEFIYKRMVEERDKGTPIIVISSELDEVETLADRIAIMYHGSIVGVVPQGTPRDDLGLMMAGLSPGDAPTGGTDDSPGVDDE